MLYLGMVTVAYTERIREARPKLSKSFKRLADYILDSYIQAALMTASELAHEVNVDAATVVRFAQALQYSGFPELQDEIKDRVLADLHLEPGKEAADDGVAAVLDRGFQSFQHSLDRTSKLLDHQAADQLATQIQSAHTVLLVAAYRHRGLVQFFLDELGKFSILGRYQPPEPKEISKALAAAGSKDMLLVLDQDGASTLFGLALDQAEKLGLSTGAVVGGASFEAARKAEAVLEFRAAEEGESEALLIAAIFESLLKLLRLRLAKEHKDYQAREKRSFQSLANQV